MSLLLLLLPPPLMIGVFSGLAACFLIVSMHLLWRICEWMYPKSSIEVCPDVVHLLKERQRNKSSSI